MVSELFTQRETGIFVPIRYALLDGTDHYRHRADLTDYAYAHRSLDRCYADVEIWTRKAICNVATSGKFSSDRIIREYADEIWDLKTSPVS